MKKTNSLHYVGLVLLFAGFLMAVGLFNFYFCFGATVFGACVGLNVNLGFWFGILFAIVGLLLVLRGR